MRQAARPRPRPRLRLCGAAMLEAVIVLPVLVMLLAAVPLIAERYGGRQQALLEARRCAWSYALSGCTREADGCGGFETEAAPETEDESVVTTARSESAGGADVFELIPGLTRALEAVLGETARASVAIELRERDGVRRRARADLAVACNERPRNVLDMARQVFCDHLPALDCGDRS